MRDETASKYEVPELHIAFSPQANVRSAAGTIKTHKNETPKKKKRTDTNKKIQQEKLVWEKCEVEAECARLIIHLRNKFLSLFILR
jgi:hypothetical protein